MKCQNCRNYQVESNSGTASPRSDPPLSSREISIEPTLADASGSKKILEDDFTLSKAEVRRMKRKQRAEEKKLRDHAKKEQYSARKSKKFPKRINKKLDEAKRPRTPSPTRVAKRKPAESI
ncbi:hypothetical protein GcM1_231005 [Golovinomyces cichoracearum]|uniref:Uncharacterized protein n=1 Tax=Golovinomyces cichoracearum TaxID=62708 RepID=A0A420IMK1_9PEZI|nr:hypothetical protein GcM1_231005 [Golovinomyces cichoracearum]